MKLKCLGAYPRRKQSIIIEEWGFKKIEPGELTHELSEYEASLMLKKYPTIFEKVLEEQKDKMQRKPRATKEL